MTQQYILKKNLLYLPTMRVESPGSLTTRISPLGADSNSISRFSPEGRNDVVNVASVLVLLLPFTTGLITTTGIELFNNCELAVTLFATAVAATIVAAPLTAEMAAVK